MASLVATAVFVPCAAAEEMADIRDDFARQIGESNIGAGYAQMLNFFIDPGISASLLEADDGTNYEVFKLPLQYELPPFENGWQVAVRGTLSHASAENTFSIFEGEAIDGTWEALSGQLGAALIIPAGGGFSWFAAGQAGVARLENEADYGGPLSRDLLAPLVDGILFNWETDARILGVTGGVGYSGDIGTNYKLDVTSRYTFSRISSVSESPDLAPFDEDTGVLSIIADLEHPWNRSIASVPLFGTAHVGTTVFTGANRRALGFDHFYLLGYSVGLDVSEKNRFFEAVSIGAQANFGADVSGFSLRFGWRLK